MKPGDKEARLRTQYLKCLVSTVNHLLHQELRGSLLKKTIDRSSWKMTERPGSLSKILTAVTARTLQ